MAQLPRRLIDDLPDDGDEAFVMIEAFARSELYHRLKTLGENESALNHEIDYMARVVSAAAQYEIEPLSKASLPYTSNDKAISNCQHFRNQAARTVVELQLRAAQRQRRKKFSVRLDVAAKKKLRQLLEQVRKLVDEIDLSPGKKERLYARIHDLQEEIDRDRTRLEQVGAFVIEVMNLAKECEPLVGIAERISATFGRSKQDEDENNLPAPTEKKRIEPPRVEELRTDSVHGAIDDEIPS